MLFLQLCLDHLHIVLHGLAVPLTCVVKRLIERLGGSTSSIRPDCTDHQTGKGEGMLLHLIGSFALKVITYFVHNGNDLLAEDVFTWFTTHIFI